MERKFKIGDIVICSEICNDIKEYPWYHKIPMSIIGFSEYGNCYYTDYWDSDNIGMMTNKTINGVTYESISEECLEFSIKHTRKEKLKKLHI